MDNLTHSLVGALIGQAGLKKKTGLAMPALIIGANLPDVDAACFFWLEGAEHLGFRRGITHGPPAMVLLPLILAGLLYGYDRWQASRGKRPEDRLPVSFKWLFLLSFIGCLTHPALDWLNVYGIRLLEPFSSQWFYGDTLFIIDIWLWLLMGFSLWWSTRGGWDGESTAQVARLGLLASVIWIFLNWMITNYFQSIIYYREAHTQDAIASPVPFNPFERELITVTGFPWPASVWVGGETVGDYDIGLCDLDKIRNFSSEAEAFIFWARAPVLEKRGEQLWLRDARFMDPRAGDRFAVQIPADSCRKTWLEEPNPDDER